MLRASLDGYDPRMSFRLAAVLATALVTVVAHAGPVDTATPIYHGILDVLAARGTIDPANGNAMLRIHGWRLLLSPDSDGIFPDQEPTLIALSENNFFLPAGSLKASGKGRHFRYRAPNDAGPRSIRWLRLDRRRDGTYRVSFMLTGIDLSRLTIADRDCVPMAFIVGDDDGFSGAKLRRPSFASHQLLLPGECDVGNDWPWIR